MKKRVLCCLLMLCMVITMAPAMAWAGEGDPETPEAGSDTSAMTLNIADGSITITDTGYKQGTAETETAWDDSNSNREIIITGTATTANTITVNGGNPTLIFRGLNVTRNNSVSSSNPVIAVNSDATIKLNGNNTIDSSGATTNSTSIRHNIISIGDNAKLSVTSDNNGKLTMKRTHYSKPAIIGTGGTFELISGTVDITGKIQTKNVTIQDGLLKVVSTDNSSDIAVNTTDLNLKGGTLEATGRLKAVATTNFAMSGGKCILTADSGNTCLNATTCNISGGTLDFSTASITGTTSITGGNINNAPITDAVRTRTELYFVNEAGTLLKNTEVKVTEGEDNTWTAHTNANGVVITYLDNDTTSIKAAVGDGEAHEYQLQTRNGKQVALIGTDCICDEEGAIPSIQWTGADSFEMYGGMGTYSMDMIPSLKKADGCVAPFHPGYDVFEVTVEVYVDDVKQETASDYATYSNGKLTLNEKGQNYTVKLIAESENSKLTQEKTLEVIQHSDKGFNLMSGSITISEYENDPFKTVYKQGSEEYIAEEGETVAITGQGTTTNKLTITSGKANVLLDNVNITDTTQDRAGATGIIAIKGGILNVKLKGTNTLTRSGCVIYVGKQGSTNPSEAVLNISCSEEEACDEINCPHSLTVKNTFSNPTKNYYAQTAAIGGARNDNGASGTITLESGKLIVSAEGMAATIGSPDANGDTATYVGTATYMYDINVTGGYLAATNTYSGGTVIGLGRYSSKDSVANINITGGTVEATSTGESTAIGAANYSDGLVNLKIGSDDSIDKSSPVVNAFSEETTAIGVGMRSYCGMVIEIKSGTVTAVGNQVGIGFAMNSTFAKQTGERSITITGGDVTAEGYVGIGAYGPGYNTTNSVKCDVDITIGGDSVVNATGSMLAIGFNAMGTNSQVDIAIEGSAQVTAESPDGIAIGSKVGSLPGTGQSAKAESTTVTITGEAAVDLSGAVAVSSSSGDLTANISSTGEINITGEVKEAMAIQGGTTVKLTDGEENTTVIAVPEAVGSVTVPAEKLSEVEVKQDGSISLPEGSKITDTADNEKTLVSGGTVSTDGAVSTDGITITENTDGTLTVTEPGGKTATIVLPDGETITAAPNGTITVPGGATVNGVEIPAGTGDITLPADKMDQISVSDDDSVNMPAGSVISKADGTVTTLPSGGSVDSDGTASSDTGTVITENVNGTVTVTKPDEAPITIAPPTTGGEITVEPDGSITVPEGSKVNDVDIPTGTGNVTLPADKVDQVSVSDDDSVNMPAGSVITKGEGENQTTTTLPSGGSVSTDGTPSSSTGNVITENTDGTVTVTDKNGNTNTINPPEGSKVEIEEDGTVKIPAGSEVTDKDGNTNTMGNGGTITEDGTVIKKPSGGGYYPITPSQPEEQQPEEPSTDIEEIKAELAEYALVARSEKTTAPSGKKAIKITWYDKNGGKLDLDGVEIFRSTKRNSGYGTKPIYTSKSTQYYNTSIKTGVRYYYKLRGYKLVDGQKYYTEWSLKAIRTW